MKNSVFRVLLVALGGLLLCLPAVQAEDGHPILAFVTERNESHERDAVSLFTLELQDAGLRLIELPPLDLRKADKSVEIVASTDDEGIPYLPSDARYVFLIKQHPTRVLHQNAADILNNNPFLELQVIDTQSATLLFSEYGLKSDLLSQSSVIAEKILHQLHERLSSPPPSSVGYHSIAFVPLEFEDFTREEHWLINGVMVSLKAELLSVEKEQKNLILSSLGFQMGATQTYPESIGPPTLWIRFDREENPATPSFATMEIMDGAGEIVDSLDVAGGDDLKAYLLDLPEYPNPIQPLQEVISYPQPAEKAAVTSWVQQLIPEETLTDSTVWLGELLRHLSPESEGTKELLIEYYMGKSSQSGLSPYMSHAYTELASYLMRETAFVELRTKIHLTQIAKCIETVSSSDRAILWLENTHAFLNHIGTPESLHHEMLVRLCRSFTWRVHLNDPSIQRYDDFLNTLPTTLTPNDPDLYTSEWGSFFTLMSLYGHGDAIIQHLSPEVPLWVSAQSDTFPDTFSDLQMQILCQLANGGRSHVLKTDPRHEKHLVYSPEQTEAQHQFQEAVLQEMETHASPVFQHLARFGRLIQRLEESETYQREQVIYDVREFNQDTLERVETLENGIHKTALLEIAIRASNLIAKTEDYYQSLHELARNCMDNGYLSWGVFNKAATEQSLRFNNLLELRGNYPNDETEVTILKLLQDMNRRYQDKEFAMLPEMNHPKWLSKRIQNSWSRLIKRVPSKMAESLSLEESSRDRITSLIQFSKRREGDMGFPHATEDDLILPLRNRNGFNDFLIHFDLESGEPRLLASPADERNRRFQRLFTVDGKLYHVGRDAELSALDLNEGEESFQQILAANWVDRGEYGIQEVTLDPKRKELYLLLASRDKNLQLIRKSLDESEPMIMIAETLGPPQPGNPINHRTDEPHFFKIDNQIIWDREKDRLLIAVNEPAGTKELTSGVYAYSPNTTNSIPWKRLKGFHGKIQWMGPLQDRTLSIALFGGKGSTDVFTSSGFLQLNVDTNVATTVLAFGNKGLGETVHTDATSRTVYPNLEPPFLIHAGRVWFYGDTPGYLDLQSGERTLFPELMTKPFGDLSRPALIPHPSTGDVYLLHPSGLHRLRPERR